MKKLNKVVRFIKIYGPIRTWFKLSGRVRGRFGLLRPWLRRNGRNIGVIGCGQFAFSTIGYSLSKHYTSPFADCYDINSNAQSSFADFYRIKKPTGSALNVINNQLVRYIYIASNHASHADYAVQALDAEKIVYVEKPIAVTRDQLANLLVAVARSGQPIYAGYNRPFSPAIRKLRALVGDRSGPVTLTCFISGHSIALNHWYRDPAEGTRICGNVGHWLDLAVHVLSWGVLADRWKIAIAYSNSAAKDDDISITMTNEVGDLSVIVLTARSEPFEGINETICFQKQDTICKIDDFRAMKVWQGDDVLNFRFWPKDVGHERALHQPFEGGSYRDWNEVVKSTLLMLHIMDMVKAGEEASYFSFDEARERLPKCVV